MRPEISHSLAPARRRATAFVALSVLAVANSRVDAQSEALQPLPRHHHGLTYDPVRRQVVMFAGYYVDTAGRGVMLDDLWRWDGQRWQTIASSTGLKVVGHSFVSDSAGHYNMVGEVRGLTSRWDGRAWSILVQDSTRRRGGAAAAYDFRRKRLVQFGGSPGPGRVAEDTWEFDGARWSRVDSTGPAPRMIASMVFDERRGVMVMFGGANPRTNSFFGDTWEWDGARWTRVADSGPAPRRGAGMAYDSRRGEVILFGGDSAGVRLDDTWLWNGSAWRRIDAIGPSPRGEPFMAFDRARGVAVLFGGWGGKSGRSLGDTWEWDGARWAQRAQEDVIRPSSPD